jgi:hypothetical protein
VCLAALVDQRSRFYPELALSSHNHREGALQYRIPGLIFLIIKDK